MGYLNIDSSSANDFTKAVISLWFRVPQASLQACHDHYVGRISSGDQPASLWGILPLITFGGPLTQPFITNQEVQLDGPPQNPDTPSDLVTFVAVASEYVYLDPSVIGINVANFPTSISFIARFQSTATCVKNAYQVTAAAWTNPGNIQTAQLESVITGPQSFNITVNLGDPTAFVDMWHHVLISCDISEGVSCVASDTTPDSVISSAELFVAIDDVNYNGMDAFDYWVGGGDLNAVITVDSMDTASKGAPPYSLPAALEKGLYVFDETTMTFVWDPNAIQPIPPVPDFNVLGEIAPTATVAPTPIPFSENPAGIPSTPDQVDNIFKVEMAEFQMFTGVTLDTSVESNRRAFIDAKGAPVIARQLPVNPLTPLDIAGAVPTRLPAPPVKLLGQVPDIAFTTASDNWIGGKNQGSAKIKTKKTGTIKPFTPAPKLGK
jgi:hypothetical protein